MDTDDSKQLSETTITEQQELVICLAITTLNVDDLNSPVQRCRLAEWIKTQDPPV